MNIDQLIEAARHQNQVINDQRGNPVAVVMGIDRFNAMVGGAALPRPRGTRKQRKQRANAREAEVRQEREAERVIRRRMRALGR